MNPLRICGAPAILVCALGCSTAKVTRPRVAHDGGASIVGVAGAAKIGGPPYTVIFKDRELGLEVDSLEGTPGHPGPDDVLHLDEIPVRLGPRGRLELRIEEEPGVRLVRRATSSAPGERGETIGLRLDEPSTASLRALVEIDPVRTCVRLDVRLPRQRLGRREPSAPLREVLDALPAGLRCLEIASREADEVEFSGLARLASLEYLIVDVPPHPWNMQWITSRDLRYLSLAAKTIVDAERLDRFTRLRELHVAYLDSQYSEARLDLSGVAALSDLRRLFLGESGATDLTPLARLTRLTFLQVPSAVKKLPAVPIPTCRPSMLPGDSSLWSSSPS